NDFFSTDGENEIKVRWSMSRLAGYVRSYFSSVHLPSLLFISLILCVLTIVNYKTGLYAFIMTDPSFTDRFLRAIALFYPVFVGTY
ncbi:MAG: hypothetical protein J7497_15390, partial [Chitinophagaceae bacterium]|nr:hypothetical protein [Chitinophagaceae bacterium]